ncbi:MAG TPA: hypothetical protein VEA60_11575 [Allosphingosinicella sp.]|nr:hypothetical protein [Allosphingosinicella sp.]
MTYRITGMGLEVVESFKPTLAEAARTASKMIDQGVADVRVFDAAGREVQQAERDQAWRDSTAGAARPRNALAGAVATRAGALARTIAILLAGLTIIFDAVILVNHMRTVRLLRTYGVMDYPLVEPLIFLPLLGLAGTAWLLLKRHDWIALATAGLSLALAFLFWVSQGVAGAG